MRPIQNRRGLKECSSEGCTKNLRHKIWGIVSIYILLVTNSWRVKWRKNKKSGQAPSQVSYFWFPNPMNSSCKNNFFDSKFTFHFRNILVDLWNFNLLIYIFFNEGWTTANTFPCSSSKCLSQEQYFVISPLKKNDLLHQMLILRQHGWCNPFKEPSFPWFISSFLTKSRYPSAHYSNLDQTNDLAAFKHILGVMVPSSRKFTVIYFFTSLRFLLELIWLMIIKYWN